MQLDLTLLQDPALGIAEKHAAPLTHEQLERGPHVRAVADPEAEHCQPAEQVHVEPGLHSNVGEAAASTVVVCWHWAAGQVEHALSHAMQTALLPQALVAPGWK